jgi:cytidylate kinase
MSTKNFNDDPTIAALGGAILAAIMALRILSGRTIDLENMMSAEMAPSTLVVAIDGPSGSGKSTVARGVARALGLRYLDTGATYRALTWAVLDRQVDPSDVDHVVALADTVQIEVSTDPETSAVAVDGRDVAVAIRGPEVTTAVSAVSAIPHVRERMVALQRAIIGSGGIVVEGRDIGTVVCPDAPVKIFLTASSDARASRRWADTLEAPAGSDVEAVKADLARRDKLDSTRVDSPLAKAADAVSIDSTTMDVAAVIAFILDVVAERASAVGAHSDRVSGDHR